VSIHHGNNAAAKAFCSSFDAELVSIETVDENWYVARLCHWQSCWIGLEEKGEGQWSWSDGDSSGYRNWQFTQPDNHGGVNEKHAVMNMVY